MADAPLRLASRSPRRAALLRDAGIPFVPGPVPDVDETLPAGLDPSSAVRRLAERKARAALALVSGETVLTADTLVVLEHHVFGKPADGDEARRMLERLSDRSHRVFTGVAVARGKRIVSDVAFTVVRFRRLDSDEIASYVASGEPLDKAGAYGIQGAAGRFVEALDGSLDTVIGLPLELVRSLLSRLEAGA